MLSKIAEQVLIGSILGDGSITKNGEFRETHCAKQKDYLFWKRKILKKEFRTNMRYKIIDKKNRDNPNYWTKQNQYRLSSKVSPILKEYRKLCYPNGKKAITNKFLDKIGKLAIVVWYFDDGSYGVHKNGIQIHSLCFSLEENKKLQKMLKDRFGLNFWVGCSHPNRTKFPYYLFCHGKETDNFLSFIKKNAPYTPKSMTYKMGKFHKGNLKWIEEKRKDLQRQRHNYRQTNKERLKKIDHEYYLKNKTKINKKQIEYYQNNKEKWIGYIRKRREHPEKLKEMYHRYYESHKEKYHKYYKKNMKRIKKQHSERISKWIANGICTWCREKNDFSKSKYLCAECQNKKNIRERNRRMNKFCK